MREPIEPPHSCPSFDSAIEEIEKARDINFKIREWGNAWRDKYYELEKEKDDELKYLEKQHEYKVERLHEKIEELEFNLKQISSPI